MSFLSQYSTTVKYLASILATTAIVSGTIYAVSITSLTQTAATGDTITANWVNAVNGSASAAASTYFCVPVSDTTTCGNALATY